MFKKKFGQTDLIILLPFVLYDKVC